MYYWDQPDPAALSGADRPGRPVNAARPGRLASGGARRGRAGGTGPAARAVQVALDRRDNGGDSGAPDGK